MITKLFGGSIKPYVFESLLVSRYQANLAGFCLFWALNVAEEMQD